MSKKIITLFLLISGSLWFIKCTATPVLPDFFSDGMLLQQNTDVKIWGKAAPGNKVNIHTSWNQQLYETTADADGNFTIKIKTPAASYTPYFITVSDKDSTVQINNILAGEVWLCSGQSNMVMPVKGFVNQPVFKADEILLDSKSDAIRILRIPISKEPTPQENIKGIKWETASPLSVKETSAVAYLYAKQLHKMLGVPVGIIVSAVGGTKIQAWMSKPSLADFYKNTDLLPTEAQVLTTNNTPTVLFNTMIHPLIGYGIRGMIWYQGEANRLEYKVYDSLMYQMFNDWRNRWGIGEGPVYYVQIAPWKYKASESDAIPRLREAQEKAMALIPHSGMVCTIDIGNEYSVHPPDKLAVAKRLSLWALAKTYQVEGLNYKSPAYQAHVIKNDTVILQFNNAENGLSSFDKPITAFELAGADGKFYPAAAQIPNKSKTIRLVAARVKKPVYIRYAFKDFINGNIYNTEGLPLLPFRTDLN